MGWYCCGEWVCPWGWGWGAGSPWGHGAGHTPEAVCHGNTGAKTWTLTWSSFQGYIIILSVCACVGSAILCWLSCMFIITQEPKNSVWRGSRVPCLGISEQCPLQRARPSISERITARTRGWFLEQIRTTKSPVLSSTFCLALRKGFFFFFPF